LKSKLFKSVLFLLKREMKNKTKKNNRNYLLLIVLIIISISLLSLVISATRSKTKELEEQGLPSLGIWKPLISFIRPVVRPITTNQTIQNQTETPSDKEVFKQIAKEYWFSYIVLIAIIIVFIGVVFVIFRIYNG